MSFIFSESVLLDIADSSNWADMSRFYSKAFNISFYNGEIDFVAWGPSADLRLAIELIVGRQLPPIVMHLESLQIRISLFACDDICTQH